jgi:hypothetical protein
MFSGDLDAAEKAATVAAFLGDYDQFKSHSRGIDRDRLRDLGLKITDLEDDPKLQDLVLSVHHSVAHTMSGTGTVKLVENQIGKAWITRVGMIQVPVQVQAPAQPGGPGSPPALPPGAPQGNRQQRRAAEAEARKNKK